ncbi:MAG: hypothetical protein AB7R00_25340 [Kofleriaceae bacterium]
MYETDEGILESELKRLLFKSLQMYRFSSSLDFEDLVWDLDLDRDERSRLDPPVIVNAVIGPRQIVLQLVRGQVRYWLTSERDPLAQAYTADTEIGVVKNAEDAAALCAEFLNSDVPPCDLVTPRFAGGMPLGRRH